MAKKPGDGEMTATETKIERKQVPSAVRETLTASSVLLFVGVLIYATGFVVTTTFFGRLGMSNADIYFLRPEYIQAGILALLGPALLSVLVLLAIYVASLNCSQNGNSLVSGSGLRITWAHWVITAALLPLLVVLVLFASRELFESRQMRILLSGFAVFFLISTFLFGFMVIARRVKELSEGSAAAALMKGVYAFVRWALALIYVLFLITFLVGLWFYDQTLHDLVISAWRPLAFYLSILALFGLILWRMVDLFYKPITALQQQILIISGVTVVVLILYLSALAFAYSIYGFIPAQRGGGDFTTMSEVVLDLKGPAESATLGALVATHYSNGMVETKPVLLVRETSNTIFIADPSKHGGPHAWRSRHDAQGKLAAPDILGVSRAKVVIVNYRAGIQAEERAQ